MKKRTVSILLVVVLIVVNMFIPVSAMGAPGAAESVFMEDMVAVASGKYTGNQGDSFIDIIGTRNGNLDINDLQFAK